MFVILIFSIALICQLYYCCSCMHVPPTYNPPPACAEQPPACSEQPPDTTVCLQVSSQVVYIFSIDNVFCCEGVPSRGVMYIYPYLTCPFQVCYKQTVNRWAHSVFTWSYKLVKLFTPPSQVNTKTTEVLCKYSFTSDEWSSVTYVHACMCVCIHN